MHAAYLAAEILCIDNEAVIYGWGGENMKSAGVNILKNYSELAFMGFWEVIKNLRKILAFLNLAKEHIEKINPDVIILIDYAGFNMRIAKWAKTNGYKVVYYIAPKAWAWRPSRAHLLRKYTDILLLIFPFEKAFFDKYKVNCIYVGNPLLDEIRSFKPKPHFKEAHQLEKKPIVALLPGSRKQEIERMMSVMAEMSMHLPQYHWVVAGVSNLPKYYYNSFEGRFKLIFNETYDLLSVASVAVVTSGTATLETAFFKVPQIVVYKANPVSYSIAKRLLTIPYISLVNLVAEKEVVKELIQSDFTVENVTRELKKLLNNNIFIEKQLIEYDKIIEKMGDVGASTQAADAVYLTIKND